jgi:hypothetical protein
VRFGLITVFLADEVKRRVAGKQTLPRTPSRDRPMLRASAPRQSLN